jgi:threonine dehydrogenase-like Zn-dependent dehydrogenase
MTGHGGHAPYMLVPARPLVPLPEAVSFEEGAAISCGTGTAYGAVKRLDVSGRDTLAVFGQGPVGLSATMLGKAMGARVIAMDVGPERRRLARELGADEVLDPSHVDPVRTLRELTQGEGVEVALDCSGNSDGRLAAVRRGLHVGPRRIRRRGKQDHVRRQPGYDPPAAHHHASWTFSAVGQEECARFVAARRIPLARLLTHRFRLEEAEAASALRHPDHRGRGCSPSDRWQSSCSFMT